jgi:2-C-methyl-D-erythritol 4-phosphate cytidylyltransferase
MVEWSIAAFRAAGGVSSIVIACPPGHVRELGSGHDLGVVEGGATRAESVANALDAVETELVAIHDAARPLVTSELIEGTLNTLLADDDAAGAIAATPLTDTIKRVGAESTGDVGTESAEEKEGSSDRLALSHPHRVSKAPIVIEETLDRDRLWAAQTPQIFRTEALRRAMDDAERAPAATDEAMLVEAAEGKVLIYPSPPGNLKVTTPLDLRLAELILAERQRAGG